jgi:hypothetical protein
MPAGPFPGDLHLSSTAPQRDLKSAKLAITPRGHPTPGPYGDPLRGNSIPGECALRSREYMRSEGIELDREMYEALAADGHRWRDAMANQRIYTAGYGGRHPDEFLELLPSHQITRSIDVRVRPAEASMGVYKKAKQPDRGIEGLLDRAGISYAHFLELGLFRGLEDWKQRYRALIQAAGPLLLDRPREIDESYCLLCAEKDVANCHRGIIADAIARERHSVVHL